MLPPVNTVLWLGLLLSGIYLQNVKSIPVRQEPDKQSIDLEIEGIKHVREEDGIDIDQILALTSSPIRFEEMSSQTASILPVVDEMKHENQTDDNMVTSDSSIKSLTRNSSSDSFPVENQPLENINKIDLALLTDDDVGTTAVFQNSEMELTTNTPMSMHTDKHLVHTSKDASIKSLSSVLSVTTSSNSSSQPFSDEFSNHQGVEAENATSLVYVELSEETDNQQSSENSNPLDGGVIEADEDEKENQEITRADDDDDNDDDDGIDADQLPIALQNLPHDIPKDRTIAEVLAENTVKDKQFDELRIKELIHELMTHTLGFGEVYSDEPDYEMKDT